jgi:peptide/nickel transport system ATP-binding protein
LAEIDALRREMGVGVLLITHDLGVVADVADRVVVMYAGRVVEEGDLSEIFYDPLHPYTWGLLGSVPRVDRERPERLATIAGNPPSLLHPPSGCHFRPRCPWSFEACTDVPELRHADASRPDHVDRCFLTLNEKRSRRMVGDAIGLPASARVPKGSERAESDGLNGSIVAAGNAKENRE